MFQLHGVEMLGQVQLIVHGIVMIITIHEQTTILVILIHLKLLGWTEMDKL